VYITEDTLQGLAELDVPDYGCPTCNGSGFEYWCKFGGAKCLSIPTGGNHDI